MEEQSLLARSSAGIDQTTSVTQAHTQTPPSAKHKPETIDLGRDVFDREHQEHLDAETLEAVLAELLDTYPEAPVGAHNADGVMVAMPESIPLRRNPVLEARSGLDLIIYDENLMRGWERVLAEGAARYPVRPVGHPDITGTVYGLDLRETHGVILVVSVFTQTDAAGHPVARGEVPKAMPRFATLRKDQRSVILTIDEAITKILGWSAEEMTGRRSIEFIHPDDRELAVDNWIEMLASAGPGRRVRLRHRRRDESWTWFEVTNHNLLERSRSPLCRQRDGRHLEMRWQHMRSSGPASNCLTDSPRRFRSGSFKSTRAA